MDYELTQHPLCLPNLLISYPKFLIWKRAHPNMIFKLLNIIYLILPVMSFNFITKKMVKFKLYIVLVVINYLFVLIMINIVVFYDFIRLNKLYEKLL